MHFRLSENKASDSLFSSAHSNAFSSENECFLICFRRSSTRLNERKRCWNRHYMTFFFSSLFSKAPVFTPSHQKRSVFVTMRFQQAPLLKPFSKAFHFISVFGRFFSKDESHKCIIKKVFVFM